MIVPGKKKCLILPFKQLFLLSNISTNIVSYFVKSLLMDRSQYILTLLIKNSK